MTTYTRCCVVVVIALLASACSRSTASVGTARAELAKYEIHDTTRAAPTEIDPGSASTSEHAGRAPSDAIVLFDGTDLREWADTANAPAQWTVRDGYFEVRSGSGAIHTKRDFGSVQLHVEWASPAPPRGTSQDRGNSGVFLMSRYEVQVLDSYRSRTYADGQAAAVYGQYPPLVNATRPPGEWQTYDIVFHAPRFAADGALLRPAHVTVIHNGVLVQDNVELTGPTAHHRRPPYAAHPDRLPLMLQDHEHPVRYRNIWVRELADAR